MKKFKRVLESLETKHSIFNSSDNLFHDDPLTSSFNALRFSDRVKWKRYSSNSFGIYFQYPPELNLREDTSSILLGNGSEESYNSPIAIFMTSGSFEDIAHNQYFVRREYDKANNLTIIDSTQWDVLGGRQNSDRDSASIIHGHNFKGLRGAPVI